MAYNRTIELKIGENGQGLLISDLDVEFEVERSNTFSLNTCKLKIYNANENTRKNILKRNNNVVLSVGYEDEGMGTIFIGNIVSSSSILMSNGDYITDIEAASLRNLSQPIEHITVSLSYGPNIKITEPLKAVASALGVIVLGASNASGITLPNGWCFAGTARQALMEIEKRLRPHGIGFYQDNTEIVIYNRGDVSSRFEGVLLSKASGLLSIKEKEDDSNTGDVPVENKKTIEFSSIMNPSIQVNGLLVVQGEDTYDGSYLVEKVIYSGNNFGGDYKVSGEAIA